MSKFQLHALQLGKPAHPPALLLSPFSRHSLSIFCLTLPLLVCPKPVSSLFLLCSIYIYIYLYIFDRKSQFITIHSVTRRANSAAAAHNAVARLVPCSVYIVVALVVGDYSALVGAGPKTFRRPVCSSMYCRSSRGTLTVSIAVTFSCRLAVM